MNFISRGVQSNKYGAYLSKVTKYHRGKTRTVASARKACYCSRSIARQVHVFNPVM